MIKTTRIVGFSSQLLKKLMPIILVSNRKLLTNTFSAFWNHLVFLIPASLTPLTNLQSRWTRLSGPNSISPNPRFGPELATQLRSYNSAQYDKIAVIRDNIADSQVQTTKNLSLALERGEAIDEMSDKAVDLRDSAQTFHRESTKLKNQMCWQKWSWWLLGGGIAVVVVIVVIVVFTV
jgi:hypothetical protein